jgi:hypothetical protein
VLAGGALWLVKHHSPAPLATSPEGRKILYYQSPMHPWIKSDKPGKCPICGMNLVPVYENAESTNTGFGLKLNADSVNVANVQTATVERGGSSTLCGSPVPLKWMATRLISSSTRTNAISSG